MAPELVQLVSIILSIHVEFLHAQRFMRGCVFESSSRLRTNDAVFTVQDIDFTLCTHYIYASAKVDVNDLTVAPAYRSDEEGPTGLYKQFNDGKNKVKYTKTILSVGGEDAANDAAFESLYNKDASFQQFSQHAIKYVKDQGFDGINIHWEMANDNSGKTKLTKLLQALRKVVNQDDSTRLLLTMTGHAVNVYIRDKYEIPELNKVVDYVFVNSKHLITFAAASFIAPVYYKMGIPGTINCLVCALMDSSQRYFDNVQKNPYLVHGDEWVGYIDTVSLDTRIHLMREWGLAGLYFMNLDEDDFSGTACNAGRFPLITYLRDKLHPVRPTPEPPETTTVMTDTTSEAQTDDNSDLITTPVRIAPTTKTTITEKTEKEENSFTAQEYIILIVVFIIGHVMGHLFMRFTWQTFELYKQL